MGIIEVLTIVFIVLKLVGAITWSWWLVFLPLITVAGLYLIAITLHGFAFVKMNHDFKKFK